MTFLSYETLSLPFTFFLIKIKFSYIKHIIEILRLYWNYRTKVQIDRKNVQGSLLYTNGPSFDYILLIALYYWYEQSGSTKLFNCHIFILLLKLHCEFNNHIQRWRTDLQYWLILRRRVCKWIIHMVVLFSHTASLSTRWHYLSIENEIVHKLS